MAEKFVVTLTAEERHRLTQLTTAGKGAAATLTHARILLGADAASTAGGHTDEAIAAALSVSPASIARVRKTFVEQGLDAAVSVHWQFTTADARVRLQRLYPIIEV